jgi:GDP-D-mannose 3',5'-epimerase
MRLTFLSTETLSILGSEMKALVCGAGGFIGGHLIDHLKGLGYQTIGADIKRFEDWYNPSKPETSYYYYDLRKPDNCFRLIDQYKPDLVFNLAADMGGMGFIENNKAACMRSVSINTHMLEACIDHKPSSYFYSSSACVYAAHKQSDTDVPALKEKDAYPAYPEDGYGWEKLFSERMCRHFREDYQVPTRVARYHNVYGPWGTFDGGREKAPAAICRKVITAKKSGDHRIEIWGDGEQTRSFMYIDDCIHGTMMIANGDNLEPVNLGSSELVSINQLVTIVEEIAEIKVDRRYNLDAPKGVRGRNSDNTMIKELYGWEPSISLREGLEQTYRWIYDEMERI